MTSKLSIHYSVIATASSKIFYRYLITLFLITLAGCAHAPPSPKDRRDNADQLAAAANWERQTLATEPFALVAYSSKNRQKTHVLNIYIEGDGLAWISRSQTSPDPTPLRPVGLELALKHHSGVAVYLARPCQFVEGSNRYNCNKTYWTTSRFSSEVLAASQDAINKLKQQFDAQQLQLIGYSGGGAIAALVAAQRKDVISLITVAGNLDHAAWTKEHRITPLMNSLNPADAWQSLKDIHQVHFVGEQDRIVGKNIAESYRSRFPNNKKPVLRVISNYDHHCCWVEQWSDLIDSVDTYQ